MVNIEYFASFRLIAGKKREEILIEGKPKIRDLLEKLEAEYGSTFAKAVVDRKEGTLNCVILVNGKAGSLDSHIGNGDTITFMSPIAGG